MNELCLDSNSNKPFVYRTELNWWYHDEHSCLPNKTFVKEKEKERKREEEREKEGRVEKGREGGSKGEAEKERERGLQSRKSHWICDELRNINTLVGNNTILLIFLNKNSWCNICS